MSRSLVGRSLVYYEVASIVLHVALYGVVVFLMPQPEALQIAADQGWTVDVNFGAATSKQDTAALPPKKPAATARPKYKLSLSQYVGASSENATAPADAVTAEEGAATNVTEESAGDGSALGGTVAAHRVQRLPRVLYEAKATYPPAAKQEGREARVIFKLVINQDGTVRRADVVQSAGSDFDQAATSAIKQFIFTPALLDDKPVAVEIRYTYEFTLR